MVVELLIVSAPQALHLPALRTAPFSMPSVSYAIGKTDHEHVLIISIHTMSKLDISWVVVQRIPKDALDGAQLLLT